MALKDTLDDVVTAAKDLLHGALPGASEDGPAASGAGAETESEDGDEAEAAAAEAAHEDAIELLKADHRRVEALFKEILAEKSTSLTSQRANIAKVLAELRLHAKIEETIVYPAVYGKTKRDTDERLTVLEAVEEHGSMHDLMKKIAKSSGRDETLKAKVQVLSEVTEHHVREEEATFFPEAKKLLGEEKLREIGVQIAKIKARAARGSSRKTARKTSRKATRSTAKAARATSKATRRKTAGKK